MPGRCWSALLPTAGESAPKECETADGFVLHSGRNFTFGELAEEAASRSPPRSAPLRSGRKGRLIGKPLQRLDGPAKTNGSLRFAGDVRLPAMLFASARVAPPGGQVERLFEGRAARVLQVSAMSSPAISGSRSWPIAGTWPSAPSTPPIRCSKHRKRRADPRPLFEAALHEGKSEALLELGDFDAAAEGTRPLAATYYVAPSEHLSLEPASATARWSHGAVELWSPTQAPGFQRALAAADGEVAASSATLYPMPVGEPSGKAMGNAAAPIAIALAATLKRPVQVTLPHRASRNIGPFSPARWRG